MAFIDNKIYINKNKNEEEILKVLKYSGFFVTDRNETLFSNDTKRIIKNWVEDNLSDNSYKRFKRLSYEGDKLNKKRYIKTRTDGLFIFKLGGKI